MRVLGIETSCDETGVAIYDTAFTGGQGLLSDALYSQIAMHAEYGGVVPELASRDHTRKLLPLIEQVLKDANLTRQDLDGIAYTAGPGLVGALMVGASTAHGMAKALNIPVLGVHHMEGHLLAPMLEDDAPEFPFVALLVSGGHTQLVEVQGLGHYQLLGESVDDAAGEAFDKAAKMLGLAYPGGPLVAKLAEQGDPKRFRFPRPMTDRPGLDFSFSGLKTQFLYFIQKGCQENSNFISENLADICASWQKHLVTVLFSKLTKAAKQYHISSIAIAGGVSANSALRLRLKETSITEKWNYFLPDFEYCTDNAAMIAMVAHYKFVGNDFSNLDIVPTARMKF